MNPGTGCPAEDGHAAAAAAATATGVLASSAPLAPPLPLLVSA